MTQAVDSLGKIEENSLSCLVDAEAGIAPFLGGTGSYIAGHQVSESGITALKIVVAVFFGNLGSLDLMLAEFLHVFFFLGNPDTSVVTERL